MSCPGNHKLSKFLIPNNTFSCDGCKTRGIQFTDTFYGCRHCNYDLCQKCYNLNQMEIGTITEKFAAFIITDDGLKVKYQQTKSVIKFYNNTNYDSNASDDEIKLQNPVVLVICVAEYDRQNDLGGVKLDLDNFRNLFTEKYGYTVYPRKGGDYDKKFKWSRDEIVEFIEEYRQRLFYKKRNHDGIIIIHRGHGGKGTVLSSDNIEIPIIDLHHMVSGQWREKAATYPRIFIVDSCRGGLQVKDDDDEKQAQGDKNKIRTMPGDNLVTIYGNPEGYVTWVNNEKGGYLSQAVIAALNDNIKKQMKLYKLIQLMDKKIKQIGGHQQIVQYDGSPNLFDLLIKPKK